MKRYEYLSNNSGEGTMYCEDGSLADFAEYVRADDADAYITAIEQERDEAVRILYDVCETFGDADSLCVDEAAEFLGRVEGGDNG